MENTERRDAETTEEIDIDTLLYLYFCWEMDEDDIAIMQAYAAME